MFTVSTVGMMMSYVGGTSDKYNSVFLELGQPLICLSNYFQLFALPHNRIHFRSFQRLFQLQNA